MEKKTEWNVGYWIVAIPLFMMLQNWWSAAREVEPLPYSEFERYLKEGKVAEVWISDLEIGGRLKSPDPNGKTVIAATRVEPDLAARLSQYNVPYARVIESTFLRDLLGWLAPALVFFGVWFFLFRRFAEKQGLGGFMAIGKSRAKVYMEKETGVSFDDVAGVDEAKDGAQGNRRFPEESQGLWTAGCPDPEGRAARRPARDGQDALGPGGGRSGRRALLFDQRLGVRRDVRRRRRGARARSLRAGPRQGAGHHLHR